MLLLLPLLWALLSSRSVNADFNQSVDDPDPRLVYTPTTSTLDPSTSAWFSVGVSFANGGSVHTSNDPTAQVSLNFTGTDFFVWGTKKYDRGQVAVQIDQFPAEYYDAWDADDITTSSVIYSKTGLPNASHTVTLSNSATDPRVSTDGNHPWIVLDELIYTVPGASGGGGGGHSHTGAIAGGTVAGLVVLALAAAAAFVFFRRRARRMKTTVAYGAPSSQAQPHELGMMPSPSPTHTAKTPSEPNAVFYPVVPYPPDTPHTPGSAMGSHHANPADGSDSVSWDSRWGRARSPVQVGVDVYPGYRPGPASPPPPGPHGGSQSGGASWADPQRPVPEVMDWRT